MTDINQEIKRLRAEAKAICKTLADSHVNADKYDEDEIDALANKYHELLEQINLLENRKRELNQEIEKNFVVFPDDDEFFVGYSPFQTCSVCGCSTDEWAYRSETKTYICFNCEDKGM